MSAIVGRHKIAAGDDSVLSAAPQPATTILDWQRYGRIRSFAT
jgi:hypothetical protein